MVECIPAKWRSSRSIQSYGIVSIPVIALSIASCRYSKAFAGPAEFFDQAVRTNPKSAPAYKGRGGVMQNSGNFQAALRDYAAALRILPDFPHVLYNRSSVKTALNDIPGAIDDLTAFKRDRDGLNLLI